ncbi:hypothetical protein ACQ4M3_22100 [Leptolyngbya sp. AN03gr2]|uniref:hypothetical protein n=1 Tax=unclassified Leptolyngbya TaxID=2650499 RepID=UPI003D31A27E
MNFRDPKSGTLRQFVVIGVTVINTFAVLSLPTAIRAEDSRSCTTALFKAQNQLSANRKVETAIRIRDVSKTYRDSPSDRPMNYVFILSGADADTVMKSPQRLKAPATDVIQNCRSVGMVSFALSASGWYHSVGIMPGRKFDFFKCFEADRPTQIVWGEQYCT